MLTQFLRQQSLGTLTAIVNVIKRTNISPNALTLIGFFMTVGVAVVLATGKFFESGLLLIVSALFDALDGSLARVTNQTTRFGAFLDSTLDRYSEGIILLALFFFYNRNNGLLESVLVFVILVGSFMVSYTRARAEGLGLSLKSGWFTRTERVIVLIIGLLTGWMTPMLGVLALMTNFTAVQRIYDVRRMTSGD